MSGGFDAEAIEFGDAEWLIECRRLVLDGSPCERRSPDGESFLLIVAGTHDIYAASGSWLQRGIRTSPWEGRPLGIFLPPNTPYRLENGTGRAIVWTARQPERPEPESPKEALSSKPLLPMAGSGKAFDPATGTWKPQEAFLSSAEAILPRRIQPIEIDGVRVERILADDYKALGLRLDEVCLEPDQSVTIPPAGTAAEFGIYFETEGMLAIGEQVVEGTGAIRVPGDAPPTLHARDERAYVTIAHAGPKHP